MILLTSIIVAWKYVRWENEIRNRILQQTQSEAKLFVTTINSVYRGEADNVTENGVNEENEDYFIANSEENLMLNNNNNIVH